MGYFDRISRELDDFFRHFPRRAGALAVEHFDDSFKNRGFTDKSLEKWKPVIDRKTGKAKQRPLVQTGRLRRSVHAREDSTGVNVIADAPYAKVHNEGERVSATQRVRTHIRKRKKGKAVVVKAHSRNVNFHMPKRQLIGQSNELDRKTEEMIIRELDIIL